MRLYSHLLQAVLLACRGKRHTITTICSDLDTEQLGMLG